MSAAYHCAILQDSRSDNSNRRISAHGTRMNRVPFSFTLELIQNEETL